MLIGPLALDLRLRLRIDRDKTSSMTDWIDDLNEADKIKQKKREHFWEVFGPQAGRTWEVLVAQIRHDAEKLNRTRGTDIKINDRELIPTLGTLYIDKLSFPAVRLTIQLDIGAQSIKISQTRKETPEADYRDTLDRLDLGLLDDDQIEIKSSQGQTLYPEGASRNILERCLK